MLSVATVHHVPLGVTAQQTLARHRRFAAQRPAVTASAIDAGVSAGIRVGSEVRWAVASFFVA